MEIQVCLIPEPIFNLPNTFKARLKGSRSRFLRQDLKMRLGFQQLKGEGIFQVEAKPER